MAVYTSANMKLYGACPVSAYETATVIRNIGIPSIGHTLDHYRQRPLWPRLLISYNYYGRMDLDRLFGKHATVPLPEMDVFADSGAFSAMTKGNVIDIQQYIAWIKRYQHLFKVYAVLDVIRDPIGTLRNQQIMEDAGLRPIPAFHTSEHFAHLEHYIDHGHRYIALGGMASTAKTVDALMAWLVRCFKLARTLDEPVRYHGFASTSWKLLNTFPWYSVDSSSWNQGFLYGSVTLFDDQVGKFIEFSLSDHKEIIRAAPLLRRYGIDWRSFVSDNAHERNAAICMAGIRNYQLQEAYLNKRWSL